MESVALILFVLGALGGLLLAVRHFQGATLPMPVSVLHGLLGAAGLVVLLLAFLQADGGGLGLALGILVVAALGGFFLFSFHLRGKGAPSPVVVIHALVAVAGVVTLLLAIL